MKTLYRNLIEQYFTHIQHTKIREKITIFFCIPWVAAQVVRWSGTPVDERSSPGWCNKSCDLSAALTSCYTWSSWGTAHEGGGCDQSIGSTVSDEIIHSWVFSTATRNSPLDFFSNYCKWLIIDPTFCGSRFSTGRVLAREDFTFLYFILLCIKFQEIILLLFIRIF